MALTKRVELLFEPEQYALLERIAKQEKESVAVLIRRAVERVYVEETRRKRWEAFKRLTSEEFDFGSWEEIKADLNRQYLEDIERSLGDYKLD